MCTTHASLTPPVVVSTSSVALSPSVPPTSTLAWPMTLTGVSRLECLNQSVLYVYLEHYTGVENTCRIIREVTIIWDTYACIPQSVVNTDLGGCSHVLHGKKTRKNPLGDKNLWKTKCVTSSRLRFHSLAYYQLNSHGGSACVGGSAGM